MLIFPLRIVYEVIRETVKNSMVITGKWEFSYQQKRWITSVW
jgi:hypothetical protein